MKKNILAVFLAGCVLFLWGFVSWVILPWHNWVSHKFSDERAVSQVLKQNATTAGVYYLPYAEEDHKPGEAAAFVNVLPNGFDMNMGKLMGTALLGQILSAFLVFLLLRQVSHLSYWNKVWFVARVGLAIGFISHFPYWNWFGFPGPYILVTILDVLIAWVLAGLVLARLTQGKMA